MESGCSCSRRDFVRTSASCAAHIALMTAAAPLWSKRLWAAQERFPVDAVEPWGRLERVADGIWALVSTPLDGDRTTLCNGGIIAGRTGVVIVEAFGSDDGARWMAAQARRLAGRAPTHAVITHYHGDHTGGLAGTAETPDLEVLGTDVTIDLTVDNRRAAAAVLSSATSLDHIRPTEIDLGDRSVVLVPRRGHTDSDVTVEVPDESVVFCGDLVWNGMFPNYMDAVPTRLTQAIRLMRATEATTYVPGHGPLADVMAMDRFIDLLDDVEAAARRAMDRGITAEQAGSEYRLPAGMSDWHLFRPTYFATAIGAWMEELGDR